MDITLYNESMLFSQAHCVEFCVCGDAMNRVCTVSSHYLFWCWFLSI